MDVRIPSDAMRRLRALQAIEQPRKRFDYQHGGIEAAADVEHVARFARECLGLETVVEHSGDLHRVWLPRLGHYFWPTSGSLDEWALFGFDGKGKIRTMPAVRV